MDRRSLVKEQNHNDIFFTFFMALVWTDNLLLRYFRVLLMKVPYFWQHADMIISLLYYITLALSLAAVLRKVYIKEIFYTLLMYGVFYFHFYAFPLNETYFYTYGGMAITQSFPMFLIGICAYRINRDQTLKVLYVLSLTTIYAYVGYMVVLGATGGSVVRGGDMNAAYNLLPHVCLACAGVLRKANPWNIVAAILGCLTILFLGNRGSLLCLGVFGIITILFSGKVKRPGLFLFLSALIMAILFLFGLLDLLYAVAEKSGYSVRIFEKLQSGEIASSTARQKIAARVWEYILLYPLMGLGIFSDRRVASGFYAHNIVLEVLIDFGMTFGLILLGLAVHLLVGSYRYLRRDGQSMTLDFFSAGVFSWGAKLLLSSSYLNEPFFFFVIGFACAVMNDRKWSRRQEAREKERQGAVRLRRLRQ